MKINVNTVLCDFDGNPITVDEKGGEATVGLVLVRSALAPPPGILTPEESIERHAIALRAHRAMKEDPSDIELSAQEAAKLKADVARCFAPLVSGQVLPLLDGK